MGNSFRNAKKSNKKYKSDRMKIAIKSLSILLALAFSLSFVSCKQGAKEKVQDAGEAVEEYTEEAADKATEAAEGVAQEVKDALVEGTDFHATGIVKCWMDRDAADAECAFGVVRRGNGTADVHITRTDGSKRVIYFEIGKAVGYDTSEAASGEFSANQQGDTWVIFIGEERYEIPDAVIVGG